MLRVFELEEHEKERDEIKLTLEQMTRDFGGDRGTSRSGGNSSSTRVA